MENSLRIEGYELLSQKIYRVLKTEITKGFLEPGEKLFGNKIATDLNVSRTPAREALQRLASEGFLEISPNKSMVVAKFSYEYSKEILEIRGVLEGLAARIAANKINEREIEELENIFKKMDLSVERNDLLPYCEYDDQFHNCIFKICRNRSLLKIRNYLENFIYRFRIKSLSGVESVSVKGRLKNSLEEHRKILESLKEHNALKAERRIKKHIDNTMKNILENLLDTENENS